MSSDYTGDDTATQAPSAAWNKGINPIVRRPSDGDAANAASIEQIAKFLADLGDVAADRLAWLDSVNTFVGTQTVTGTANDAAIAATAGAGSATAITGTGTGAGAGASFEGGPTDGIGVNAVGGGANGVGLAATGQGTGAAIAATGDVIAVSGKIKTMAGNVVADGDPASDQGRVKGLQFVMTGSAPTANATSNPGADNAVGDATETVVANSNDVRGRITVTTGAATTNGVICRVTFNKAYPSTDYEVTLQPTNTATSNLPWVPHISTKNVAYFEFSSGGAGPPDNKLNTAETYGWAYHVIG
jgi:hypothetical protein